VASEGKSPRLALVANKTIAAPNRARDIRRDMAVPPFVNVMRFGLVEVST